MRLTDLRAWPVKVESLVLEKAKAAERRSLRSRTDLDGRATIGRVERGEV